MHHSQRPPNSTQSPTSRRSDAGQIRLQPRDADGLTVLAGMYAAPYDLLALRLSVSEARLRGITARWRNAGLAATGRLSAGPAWCWLTPAGMRQVGYPWEAAPPPLARLAHIRAVLAARLWLESAAEWQAGQAEWRCERELREGRTAAGRAHVPDAEVLWPAAAPGSPRAGEVTAVEVELTPKGGPRTAQIMAGLLAEPYSQVLYLCSPAALLLVAGTRARFGPDRSRITVRELPAAALMQAA